MSSLFRRRSSAEKELPAAAAAPETQPATPQQQQQFGGDVPRALLGSAATGQRRASLYPVSSLSLSRAPCLLEENELPVAQWQEYDKAFTCAWLDGRHAVVGTKCNQLLLLDVDARTGTKVRLPPAHERQPRPAGMDSPGHGVFNASGPKGSGMHTTAVSPDGRLLACGGSDATDAQIFRIERGKTSRSLYNGDDDSEEDDDEDDDPYASSRCQRRRCRDHNAAGACGPSASSAGARSYPLAPALIPTRSVYGHLDWVFGLDWITERHLVTGSRDRTLALWSVDDGDDDDFADDDEIDQMEEAEAMETDNFNDSDAENVSPNANGGASASRRRRRAVTGGGRPASAATAGPFPTSLSARRSMRPSPKAPAPLAVREEKRTRVRDVACDPTTGRVASLTTHGTLRVWDAHLNELSSWQMANDRETVCVEMGRPTARGHGLGLSRGGAGGSGAAHPALAGLVLAGSQAHVQMYDVRLSAGRVRPGTVLGGGAGGGGGGRGSGGSGGGGGGGNAAAGVVSTARFPSPIAAASTATAPPVPATAASTRDGAVAVLESPDGAHGVRSIEIRGHLLSIGTGRGRIAFADVRQLGRGWADLGPAPLKPVGVSAADDDDMGRHASLPPRTRAAPASSPSASPAASPPASPRPAGLSTPQRELWRLLARGNGRRPLAETNAMPPLPQPGDRDFGLSLDAAASLGVGAGARHPHRRPATPPSPPGPRAAAEAARAAALAAWPLSSPPADPISLAAAFEQQLERQLRDSTVSGAVAAVANAANAAAANSNANGVPLDPAAAAAAAVANSSRGRTFLQSGPGWLCANGIWLDHFAGGPSPVRHAVYCHAWAPGGDGDGGAGGLLAVGGPLATGLKGCYMAHWR